MRLATVDLLVGAAKRAKPLEGLDYQECEAGLLLPGAPAHDAIDAPFSQRPGSFGYVFVAHAAGEHRTAPAACRPERRSNVCPD